jgi:exonuclease III
MNNPARQEELKQLVNSFKPELICIQETKMTKINPTTVKRALGLEYENNFVYLLAEGTKGGILLAARESILQLQNLAIANHTISVLVVDTRYNATWMLTGVYGPQGDLEKRMFIRELRHLKQTALPCWLVIGDLNLIYREEEENIGRLNRRLMLRFRRALNHLEVKEIELVGKKFT